MNVETPPQTSAWENSRIQPPCGCSEPQRRGRDQQAGRPLFTMGITEAQAAVTDRTIVLFPAHPGPSCGPDLFPLLDMGFKMQSHHAGCAREGQVSSAPLLACSGKASHPLTSRQAEPPWKDWAGGVHLARRTERSSTHSTWFNQIREQGNQVKSAKLRLWGRRTGAGLGWP